MYHKVYFVVQYFDFGLHTSFGLKYSMSTGHL